MIHRFLRPLYCFGKWSKPLKRPKKHEVQTGNIITDERGAKLSKAEEDELAKRTRIFEDEKNKFESEGIHNLRNYDKSIDKHLTNNDILELYITHHKNVNNKYSYHNLKKAYKSLTHYEDPIVLNSTEGKDLHEYFPNPNTVIKRDVVAYRKKVEKSFFNCQDIVNENFDIKPITPSQNSIRTGVLSKKVGMTSAWDRWGVKIPLTILQVDRCQVVQQKTMEKDGYSALQLGHDQMNLKKLKKPEIGHFLKAGVPPKKHLNEFRVTEENMLPVGFMLSVRHFVPGQFVDVKGTSTGKGFQGTIVRWHFGRQAMSHGNSKAHRKLGSTGQCQDPGKVAKNKKMPGRMGNRPATALNLKVFKVDFPNSLIFVKGTVPGRIGGMVKIRDSVLKAELNERYLNYPTFIAEKGKEYANVSIMPPPFEDPQEIHLHENDVVE